MALTNNDLQYLTEAEKRTLIGLDPPAQALFLKMRQETAEQERAKMQVCFTVQCVCVQSPVRKLQQLFLHCTCYLMLG